MWDTQKNSKDKSFHNNTVDFDHSHQSETVQRKRQQWEGKWDNSQNTCDLSTQRCQSAHTVLLFDSVMTYCWDSMPSSHWNGSLMSWIDCIQQRYCHFVRIHSNYFAEEIDKMFTPKYQFLNCNFQGSSTHRHCSKSMIFFDRKEDTPTHSIHLGTQTCSIQYLHNSMIRRTK